MDSVYLGEKAASMAPVREAATADETRSDARSDPSWRERELAKGGFNHTGEVTLLDPQGRVLASTNAMDAAKDAAFMDALRAALETRVKTK